MLQSPTTPVIYYAGPADPTGGGGGAAVADPATNGAQPVEGQDPAAGDGNADFWGMFPDVPEHLRPELEPHLKQVQGHVTRVEQQLSQFKPILESGYTPDQVQGLVKFSQDFDANPLESWLKMAAALQQPGPDGRPIIDTELDVEMLGRIARGEDIPDDDPDPQQPPVGQELQGVDPGLQQYIAQMQQQLQSTQQALETMQRQQEQQQTAAQRAAQQRMLTQQLGTMKETLIDGGYPAELLEDNSQTGSNGTQLMRSALITTNGNVEQAIQLLQNQRSSILKGYTEESTSGKPPKLQLDETPPGPRRTGPKNPRDSFGKANQGAAAFLARQRRAAAQG